MDKQTHTKFNLNNFLMAFSSAIDNTVSNNVNDVKYSSKAFAYIALKLANELNISAEFKSDIFSYCIINKNQVFNKNLQYIPFNNKLFLDDPSSSVCINIASYIISNIKLLHNTIINEIELKNTINTNETISNEVKQAFKNISKKESFWYDLTSNQLGFLIFEMLEDFTLEINFDDLIQFTAVVHDSIYDYISRNYEDDCIDFKAYAIANFFKFEPKDKARFIIASHLINIGYLFMPLDIVNKKDILHHTEYQILKQVPYYTNYILQQVYGFGDIATLCNTVYETIDENGYPNKLGGSSLSLKQRALSVINIYQALSEKRSYREKFDKSEIFEILNESVKHNKIDESIIESLKIIL